MTFYPSEIEVLLLIVDKVISSLEQEPSVRVLQSIRDKLASLLTVDET